MQSPKKKFGHPERILENRLTPGIGGVTITLVMTSKSLAIQLSTEACPSGKSVVSAAWLGDIVRHPFGTANYQPEVGS